MSIKIREIVNEYLIKNADSDLTHHTIEQESTIAMVFLLRIGNEDLPDYILSISESPSGHLLESKVEYKGETYYISELEQ